MHCKLTSDAAHATTTTTTTTTVLWPFIHDYPGEPVPKETSTHSHLSQSSTILYQLPPSTMIHSILPIQIARLTFFVHNLCTKNCEKLFNNLCQYSGKALQEPFSVSTFETLSFSKKFYWCAGRRLVGYN